MLEVKEHGYEHHETKSRQPVERKVSGALDDTLRSARKAKPGLDAGGPGSEKRGISEDLQREAQGGGGNRVRPDEKRDEDERKGLGRVRPKDGAREIHKAHVKGNIRMIDSYVVWVENRETKKQGSAAKLHERTTMGKHRTLGTFLRATDDEDAKERPGDRLDYGIARSDRLEADETITDSQWVFNSIGLTKLTTHVIGGKSAVWIEGRVIGANYVLQNQITTSKLNPKTGQSRVYLGSIGIFVWAK